ncbi:MAG TPA: hypothetical protein VMT76_00400, partial [Puia sp.]|nr:hypothetical protein [Puia sp.]
MINRYNYEEYFLLYVDNELSLAEKTAVEEFLLKNPDLKEEMDMIGQAVLKPEKNIFFHNKNALLKLTHENWFINLNNYQEYFLLYMDNELNAVSKKQVEEFMSSNPSLQSEFNLLLQTKFEADNSVVFEEKEALYKNEEHRRPVLLLWISSAAAVAILLVTGFLFFNRSSNGTQNKPTIIAGKGIDRAVTNHIKKSISPVTSGTSDSLQNINPKKEIATV